MSENFLDYNNAEVGIRRSRRRRQSRRRRKDGEEGDGREEIGDRMLIFFSQKFALKYVNAWYGLRLDLISATVVTFVYGGITIARY